MTGSQTSLELYAVSQPSVLGVFGPFIPIRLSASLQYSSERCLSLCNASISSGDKGPGRKEYSSFAFGKGGVLTSVGAVLSEGFTKGGFTEFLFGINRGFRCYSGDR